MEIKKRKYKQGEVLEIINACKNEYEEKLIKKSEEILELKEEIERLKVQLFSAKEKESVISSALLRAEQLSNELKEKAELQYSLEVERIKKFTTAWNDYFHALREKYPHYEPVKDALGIVDTFENTSNGLPPKKIIESVEPLIQNEDSGRFDPKRKIRDYIAATGDNGFNLDEVLNPGELQLEDICKELGLIDGEE